MKPKVQTTVKKSSIEVEGTPTPKASPTSKVEKPKKVSPEVQALVASLNKKFGNNAITIGVPKDENGKVKLIERVPTGSFTLDVALGGGIPLGRYIEISGAYSSTKTTQCLMIIKEAQQAGLICALIDVEGTTDEPYLKSLGVDVSALLYSQPDGMEEATQLVLDMQKSGAVNLAVIDSIAAMSPNKEQETSMEDTMRMGIPQQLLGEFFRKFQANNNRLNRENKRPFTVIGVNQLREKIGVYGDSEYTPGGRSKGFTASVDIRLRRGDWICEGTGENKEIVGQVVKFKIEKNKTYKRMQTGEFDFYFAENASNIPVSSNDNEKSIVMCAVEQGIIERAGAWFMCYGNKYQGIVSLINALKNNKELVLKLKTDIMNMLVTKND